MPERRGGREGDALDNATDPPASLVELSTTRLGLVREAPLILKNKGQRDSINDVHDNGDCADPRIVLALESLRDEFKSIAETYQKSLDISMEEMANCRRELEEARKETVMALKKVTESMGNRRAAEGSCNVGSDGENIDSECTLLSVEYTSKQFGKKLDINRIAVVLGIVKYPGSAGRAQSPCCNSGYAFGYGRDQGTGE